MFKKALYFTLDLVKIVVISLAIIIPIRYFLIQPFYVQGSSMEPNFHTSEYLIIDEISYRFNKPERGDVIVFKYPRNPKEYFIKRIIGLPGEKVKFENGDIYIYNDTYEHGIILEEDYLPSSLKTSPLQGSNIVELGENEYFVLGDNRNSSKDSRMFGPVDKSLIEGRVLFRGWPIDKAQFFEAPEYQF
ncbi:signal peptidase I [bacterium]|nr:signal peptidase I [bacterium]